VLEDRLLFVIGSPRSGSTLLTRMLGAHSAVHSPAEPHLLTPLAHLGFYQRVEKAPYDPIISEGAMRELVAELPRGEEDYLEALRAYTDTLYERLLESSGRRILLDKTPAYALVLDFVARLYPKARYVVLTRNPLAVWSSVVQSFFDGDHEAAHRHNPILERYVPAIARFLREQPVALHHVRYEDLVREPEAGMQAICAFAGLDFEAGMVDYGESAAGRRESARGLGDPITVARETRPTTRSLERWAGDMAGDPGKIAQAERVLASLLDQDLETWGYSRRELEQQLAAVDPGGARPKRRVLSRYVLERKLLILLRRNIHHNAFGRLLRRVRSFCDVLLR
jgi:hypothetical protein